MVKTPETRHSRQPREPLTLDLTAETVHTPSAATSGDAAEAGDRAASPSGSANDETTMSAKDPASAVETEPGASVSADQATMDPALFSPAPDSPTTASDASSEAAGPLTEGTASDTARSDSATGFGEPARLADEPAEKPAASPYGRRSSSPEAQPAPKPEPARRGGLSAVAGGLVGAIVAVAGAWLLQYAGMLPSPSRGSDATAEIATLRSEIDALKSAPAPAPMVDPALQATIDELRANFASLEKAVSAVGTDADTQAIGDRLKALETSIAGLSQSTAADPAEISALGEKVTAADTQAQAAGEAAAAVGQKVAAIEQAVAALTAKVEAQASQPKIALAIASSALKSALERGAPFTAELETLAAITPAAPQLDALRQLADAGVPTRPAIEAEMDAAAAAMIAAATPVDVNAGYFDRLVNSARSLVTIRPTGKVEGTGVPEIVARMEAAVKDGDYAAALTEYGTLPDEPKAAGADFAAKLRARLDAETLVDQAVAGAMQAG